MPDPTLDPVAELTLGQRIFAWIVGAAVLAVFVCTAVWLCSEILAGVPRLNI